MSTQIPMILGGPFSILTPRAQVTVQKNSDYSGFAMYCPSFKMNGQSLPSDHLLISYDSLIVRQISFFTQKQIWVFVRTA